MPGLACCHDRRRGRALKIMCNLAGGGVIQSCEGVSDGYELPLDGADIDPARAVRIIEGPIVLDAA